VTRRQTTVDVQGLAGFSPDLASKDAAQATDDEIKTFESIWHIVATG